MKRLVLLALLALVARPGSAASATATALHGFAAKGNNAAHRPGPPPLVLPPAVYFPLNGTGVGAGDHEVDALVYTLQGIVNRVTPRLFLDTGALDLDYPGSDRAWRGYLQAKRGVRWTAVAAPGGICELLAHFRGAFKGAVRYRSDGYSMYVAMTLAGTLDGGALPVSASLAAKLPCAGALPVAADLTVHAWPDKVAATTWAVKNLLPNCSRSIVFNADSFNNAVATQGNATLMSADLPILWGAFIMDLSVLYECDPIDCHKPTTRVATPREAALYAEIIGSMPEGVSVFGWGDPEYAYTNVTSAAGGVVFCTFSAPNLSFWRSLGDYLQTKPLRLPHNDAGVALEDGRVYVAFETNEGDTPRILTSQFTDAWLSPHRGSVPVSWAVDPYLAALLPELWNSFAGTATANDTFVAGIAGAGYVYVGKLGPHARAYETRAAQFLKPLGPNVVDVGIASNKWPATRLADIEAYRANAAAAPGGVAPDAFLNACGSAWGQSVNAYLADGTPVINSVCVGPPQNDTTNGHYLYYWRSGLNQTDPVGDLAARMQWAANMYKEPGRPLFLLLFGGLGLYGGHSDYFLFLREVMARLDPARFRAVGAQDFVRLAREAGPPRGTPA